MNAEERWLKSAQKFRYSAPQESAPYGFATKVVAAANLGLPPHSHALRLWRRYSLSVAGFAAVMLSLQLLTHQPRTQFLPLPQLDLPISENSHPLEK